MNEFLLLFAVLAAIYIFDCICTVPLTCFPIAFTGRRWKTATTILVLAGSKRRVVLTPLFPGAGMAICSDAPVSWDGSAICATTRPHGSDHRHLSISNPVHVEADELLVAREVIATCASPQTAKLLAQFVRNVSQAPVQDRHSMVRTQWESQFDMRAIRRRLRLFGVVQPHLAVDGLIVLLLLFIATPLALLIFGPLSLVVCAVVLMLMMADIIYLYVRCYRRIWPHDGVPWRHILLMVLTPPAVMRAADYLLRELLSEFHWVAVITAVGERTQKDKLIARYVRQLEYPAPWEQMDCRVGKEARRMWRATVFEFIAAKGGDVWDLAKIPVRESEEVNAFCPRCTAQFTKQGTCSDCGVELQLFL